MIQTIKQNKKAVLAFLLALVMLIGIIPFTATEVQAVTIPVGDITNNDSFGNGDAWETGDKIRLLRWADDRHTNFFLTAEVAEDGAVTWTPDKKLYWDGKGEHTLVASYPNMNLLFQNFGIPVDQSDLQKLKEADCMNAMWKGDPTTDPIDLTLKHRLSMVTVTYAFASEFADEPDITPEVYTNTRYVFFNVNTLDRQEVALEEGDDAWVKAYKHNEVDGEGNVTARKFTAIVSPDAYSADDEFIRIKIGDQVLTARMKEDITFEEGTHYTFNLKVGKDKVTIEQVSVNGNDPSIPFGDGWRSDTEEDLGAVSITDTQDEGKTAWDDGDQIIATLTSQRYGEQTAMLTFSGSDGTWSTDESFSYLENETPTVKAIYAPSNILGTGEYIEFDCELNGTELTVKLEGATRNYSRLRIVGLPNQTLTVTTMKFTPAGATEAGEHTYTLTTDNNGNAFLYGTFAEGATISVKQGNVVLKEYAFTAEKLPGGTEQGKSYVLGAVPVIDGSLGGKTTATEDDINALVELLKTYVDNGITTIIVPGTEHAMYESALGTIPAYAEALYLLTDLNEDSPYCGTIDLILPDATEIIDYSFDSVDALKSITLPKVTTVGDGAFYGCQYLEKMTFGSVITEVVEIKSGVFASLGTKSDNEACDLVLNCGQLNAEDKYKPNLESNVWYIGEWSGETEWKSITLIHTGECDECKAQ